LSHIRAAAFAAAGPAAGVQLWLIARESARG